MKYWLFWPLYLFTVILTFKPDLRTITLKPNGLRPTWRHKQRIYCWKPANRCTSSFLYCGFNVRSNNGIIFLLTIEDWSSYHDCHKFHFIINLRQIITLYFRYQLYNVDVWALLITITVLVLVLVVMLVVKIFTCCCCRRKQSSPNKNTKKKFQWYFALQSRLCRYTDFWYYENFHENYWWWKVPNL